ncbi:wax synthase family protein [Herpetosiphon llansteffanensis]|uniref:wax synthase family protein n=1 Tax=Herpetosiphon llansteffanensis TaxID=2094568 RepID=UPI000D7CE933|nr:membrane bound O-acyl transferase family-domain-containing protein [Herpetosiphon llansteffanensis]
MQTLIWWMYWPSCWIGIVASAWYLPNRWRSGVGWGILGAGGAFSLWLAADLAAWQRLLTSTAGLILLLKARVLLQLPRQELRRYSRLGLGLFMTIWPGMNPAPFRQRRQIQRELGPTIIQGWVGVMAGSCGLVLSAYLLPWLGQESASWMFLLSILGLGHFGLAHWLNAGLWYWGWPVAALFRQPLRSRSLRDFWSVRWNTAFVEMNKQLFLRPLARFGPTSMVLGIFLLSGIFHELGLSYPAQAGWGQPMAYFGLHAGLMWLERKFNLAQRWPQWLLRCWTWLAIVGPLPWLFHGQFRQALIVPALHWGQQRLHSQTLDWYLSWGLSLAAVAHAVILIASFQVPKRLNWHNDLAQLTPFNRKIMWTYGGFIVLCIIVFGCLLAWLKSDILQGQPAALGLVAFNGLFWTARVVVDFSYFKHSDWPAGLLFVIGHCCLSSTFIAIVIVDWAVIGWHLLG